MNRDEGDKKNAEKEDYHVNEARKALLQHYSSKSTLQATILLSLAVAFFTFMQTIRLFENLNPFVLCFIYSLALTPFIFLTLRALGRLIYFGAMANLIEQIRLMSVEEYMDDLIEPKNSIDEEKRKDLLPPTIIYRLEHKCNQDLKRWSRVHVAFHALTNEFYGSIISILGLFFLLLFLSLLFSFQIHSNIYFLVFDIPVGVAVSFLAYKDFRFINAKFEEMKQD
jgi:hypothetical protein